MSFCMELANILDCFRVCCPAVEEVEYRRIDPVLQKPILPPPTPMSPYQTPAQIEITPPLLPL
jgi:hypothetical protein